MQRIIAISIFLTLPLSASAGNCTGDGAATQINALAAVNDQTICATTPGGDTSQEWHQTGGTLTEYALGPASAVDPTHDVGTYSAATNITYNYTGGSSFTFEVWQDTGGNRFFCENGAGTALVATINSTLAGQQACP